MSDLISREALIKDAESWVAVDEYEKHLQKNVVEWLKEFPPAEHGTNLAEVGTDCVSRQQAIDALDQIFDRCEEIEAHLPEGDPDRTGYKMYPDYMTVWKYLHQLPSAQPEIVRCKECKHYEHGICKKAGLCVNKSPNGFCDWAERRKDG